jgi:hypothetical protein
MYLSVTWQALMSNTTLCRALLVLLWKRKMGAKCPARGTAHKVACMQHTLRSWRENVDPISVVENKTFLRCCMGVWQPGPLHRPLPLSPGLVIFLRLHGNPLSEGTPSLACEAGACPLQHCEMFRRLFETDLVLCVFCRGDVWAERGSSCC